MITRKEIAEYEVLEVKRLAFQRQVSDIEKQQAVYERHFMEEVRERGGDTRTIKTCGYIMAIKKKRGSVQWKPEFVRVAGMDAAEAVIAAQPWKDVFSMEPLKVPAPAVSAPPGPPGSLPE